MHKIQQSTPNTCRSFVVNDVLTEENLDEQLKNLAILAQSYPQLSQERRWALTQLLETTLHSGQVKCLSKDPFYKDIYENALQNLWLYVCQNIDKYNPERSSFINWIVMMLHRHFLKKAISDVTGNHFNKSLAPLDIDTLADTLFLQEQKPSLLEEIKEYVELDPEKTFRYHYIRNYPKANFQNLVKMRLSGESWQNISRDLGVKVSTLNRFYYRSIEKFNFKFKEYLY